MNQERLTEIKRLRRDWEQTIPYVIQRNDILRVMDELIDFAQQNLVLIVDTSSHGD